MNELETRFKEKLEKEITCVKNVICYNFDKAEGEKYISGEDNGFFILHTTKKLSHIRIRHNIDSDKIDLRFKMYYANQPFNDFCEENSMELGFFNGEEYETLLELGKLGFDAFRFDFGFAPITFEIKDFLIESLSEKEINNLRKKKIKRYIACIFNNLKKFPKIGDKLAKQIILDLKGKLEFIGVGITDDVVETENELKDVLIGLGYKEKELKPVLAKVDTSLPIEGQVKDALKLLLR